jgi:hypothetical protein
MNRQLSFSSGLFLDIGLDRTGVNRREEPQRHQDTNNKCFYYWIISNLVEGKLWSSFSKRLLILEGFKDPRGQGFQ